MSFMFCLRIMIPYWPHSFPTASHFNQAPHSKHFNWSRSMWLPGVHTRKKAKEKRNIPHNAGWKGTSRWRVRIYGVPAIANEHKRMWKTSTSHGHSHNHCGLLMSPLAASTNPYLCIQLPSIAASDNDLPVNHPTQTCDRFSLPFNYIQTPTIEQWWARQNLSAVTPSPARFYDSNHSSTYTQPGNPHRHRLQICINQKKKNPPAFRVELQHRPTERGYLIIQMYADSGTAESTFQIPSIVLSTPPIIQVSGEKTSKDRNVSYKTNGRPRRDNLNSVPAL